MNDSRLVYAIADDVLTSGVCVVDLGRFEALRTIASTGAVLTSPMFEWAQDAFGKDVHVASGCGGTDVCTGCRLLFLSYLAQSDAHVR